MNKVFLLLVALMPAMIMAGRISFTPCTQTTTGAPTPDYLEADECVTGGSCNFQNGTTVNIVGQFTPQHASHTLTNRLRAWVIIEIPYNLPEDQLDGCVGVAGGCPLVIGTPVGLETALFINAPLVNVSPVLEFSFRDENDAYPMCVRFTITISG